MAAERLVVASLVGFAKSLLSVRPLSQWYPNHARSVVDG